MNTILYSVNNLDIIPDALETIFYTISFGCVAYYSSFLTNCSSIVTVCFKLQHRANNPDRYFNRGCNLLKEEKERKKVCAELPKV